MPSYRVLMDGWEDASGKHGLGDLVNLRQDTPAEQIEISKLIDYGIVEPATETDNEADESTPAPRRSPKK